MAGVAIYLTRSKDFILSLFISCIKPTLIVNVSVSLPICGQINEMNDQFIEMSNAKMLRKKKTKSIHTVLVNSMGAVAYVSDELDVDVASESSSKWPSEDVFESSFAISGATIASTG